MLNPPCRRKSSCHRLPTEERSGAAPADSPAHHTDRTVPEYPPNVQLLPRLKFCRYRVKSIPQHRSSRHFAQRPAGVRHPSPIFRHRVYHNRLISYSPLNQHPRQPKCSLTPALPAVVNPTNVSARLPGTPVTRARQHRLKHLDHAIMPSSATKATGRPPGDHQSPVSKILPRQTRPRRPAERCSRIRS